MQFMVSYRGPDSKLQYKCSLCNMISKSSWNMKRHMILKHTEPTNDACQYCSKVFKHKHYLDEHIRSKVCLSKMLFQAPR